MGRPPVSSTSFLFKQGVRGADHAGGSAAAGTCARAAASAGIHDNHYFGGTHSPILQAFLICSGVSFILSARAWWMVISFPVASG